MLGFSSLSGAPLGVAVPVTLITATLDGVSATSTAGAVAYANDTQASATGVGSTSSVGTLSPKTVADVTLDAVSATSTLDAPRFGIRVTVNATGVSTTGSAAAFSAVKGNVGTAGVPNVQSIFMLGEVGELDSVTINYITITGVNGNTVLGLSAEIKGAANSTLTAVPSTSSLDAVTTSADANVEIEDQFEGLTSGFNGDLGVTGKASATLTGLSNTTSLNVFTTEVEIAVALETLLGQTRAGTLTSTGVVFDFTPFAANYSRARTITILPWQSTGATSNTVIIPQENFTVTIEPYYTAYPKTVFILN